MCVVYFFPFEGLLIFLSLKYSNFVDQLLWIIHNFMLVGILWKYDDGFASLVSDLGSLVCKEDGDFCSSWFVISQTREMQSRPQFIGHYWGQAPSWASRTWHWTSPVQCLLSWIFLGKEVATPNWSSFSTVNPRAVEFEIKEKPLLSLTKLLNQSDAQGLTQTK